VDVHALGNIDNELDVCVVVVVCATGDLDVLVRHADVLCVCLQILGCGHDGELDGTLIAKCLVSPFADGADLLDGGNTVVGNEDVGDDRVAIVGGDKVLDLARGGGVEVVATDKVRCQIELGRVAARGSSVGAVGCSSSHDVGINSHTQGGVWGEVRGRGVGESSGDGQFSAVKKLGLST
jgi:hypothetical protein